VKYTKQYDHILLDWDGNIAQTLDIWLQACREVLQGYGHNLSDEEIGASFGAFTTLAKELNIPNPHLLMQEADKISSQKLPEAELYPDALEVLEYLEDLSKPMALITSSSRNHISPILRRYNLEKFFNAIITGDDINHHKPHPEPINKALAALGASKHSTVLIGDSDKDVGAAKNSQIDCILFYPPEHMKFYDLHKLKSMSPDYIVHDFTEIMDIIK